jgi:hypothetical protein
MLLKTLPQQVNKIFAKLLEIENLFRTSAQQTFQVFRVFSKSWVQKSQDLVIVVFSVKFWILKTVTNKWGICFQPKDNIWSFSTLFHRKLQVLFLMECHDKDTFHFTNYQRGLSLLSKKPKIKLLFSHNKVKIDLPHYFLLLFYLRTKKKH